MSIEVPLYPNDLACHAGLRFRLGPLATADASEPVEVITLESVSFLTPSGLRIAGDIYGASDAPCVLLTHGGGQTRQAWDRTGELLASEGFSVVNLDLRGHGQSDWSPDGDYSVDSFAADLEAVADALARPVSLVGASLGGYASLMAIGTGRVRAERLVLVDVVPRTEQAGTERVRDFMLQHSEGFESLDEAADVIAAYLPERPRPKSTAGLEKNLRRGEDGRWHWHWDARLLQGRGINVTPEEMEAAARTITIPTLLVRGVLSDVVSDVGIEALRQQIPHLEVRTVGEAGHMVAGDRNDVFTAAILPFLRSPVNVG